MITDHTIRERTEAFWRGERPDIIPYTMYWWIYKDIKDDPALPALFDQGLGITVHPPVIKESVTDFTGNFTEYTENGNLIRRQTFRTPVGEIHQEWRNGWLHRYLLQNAEDYKVMTWMVNHTQLSPCYEKMQHLVDHGEYWQVPIIGMGRTPYQEILVDYAGLENFSFHTVDFPDEVEELFTALTVKFARKVEIIAQAPGLYVSNLENFTSESFSPAIYQRYLASIYEKFWPELHLAGKIIGTHYDGRTRSCAKIIAQGPLDIIESLTEPNEGDMRYEECRRFWPDKLFWCNIRVGDYDLSPEDLRSKVTDLYNRGKKNNGSGIAFEVSEELPQNWRNAIPTVLNTLREIS